jgi:NAD(P)-dependent dehydrogenase (short-subunit alcohol dehydrogenase family)
MTINFDGKSVLISGGARGLGRATALRFAAQGAQLTLIDVDAEGLEEVAGQAAKAGAKVQTITADISSRQACFDAVERAVAAYGKLNVLCNIAAVLRFHAVTDVTEADWQKLLAVNVSGAFFLSQAAIPHLLKSHGNIVNTASQGAHLGCAFIVPYSITKAAVLHMTKSMAMEYIKTPVRINAVSPGTMKTRIGEGLSWPDAIDTELTQRYSGIRPASEAEDVADVILFVASDMARAIHGACVNADQGVTAG